MIEVRTSIQREITMTSTSLRTMIEDKPFLTCSGIFDLVSAKLADRTGADALYMTGYGTVASYDFDAFSSLIGFEEVWAFENKYVALEAG
jgi:2-methylisocitrate lyase-like PEP mutase family enzyme